MNTSPRLALPQLEPGQAQKELIHNEALIALDAIVAAAVEEPPLASPPALAVAGACYIVADQPSGEWQGRARHLASYTAGGWWFHAAVEGMTAYIKSTGMTAAYRNGAWELGVLRGSSLLCGGQQVVGARVAAIADPQGGVQVDAEARAAIASILAAMRAHGLIES